MRNNNRLKRQVSSFHCYNVTVKQQRNKFLLLPKTYDLEFLNRARVSKPQKCYRRLPDPHPTQNAAPSYKSCLLPSI